MTLPEVRIGGYCRRLILGVINRGYYYGVLGLIILGVIIMGFCRGYGFGLLLWVIAGVMVLGDLG